jgi:GNAT superfamily N-acetyltransferase
VNPIEIRAVEDGDLPGVVETFLACWRLSYGLVLPGELIAKMSDAGAQELWTRVLADAAPGEVVVATAEGSILGVSRIAVVDTRGWLHSLYVHPAEQGRGVGGRLLAAAESALLLAGARDASLWVFRDNAPSLAFYRSHGWLTDGRERTESSFGEPELGLSKVLAP